MSTPSPFGGGNPFGDFLSQMSRLFTGTGPVNWEVARQVAASQTSEGEPEANVEPLERIRLEELIRVAELQVSAATGLEVSQTGRVLTVRPVTRTEWALATLEGWKPLLEALGVALTPAPDEAAATEGAAPEPDPSNPLAAFGGGDLTGLLGSWAKVLPPFFLGMQAGSMVGLLAQRVLGQYDLPIPRPKSDELMVIAPNLTAFATDWSLPPDDVRLWVCLSEVTHHAILGLPHVRTRMEELLTSFVSGFRPDSSALEARMTNLDLTDMDAIAGALGDPSAVLGDMQTPEQLATLRQLEALTAAIEGYVDHTMDRVGHGLIGSYGPLAEALRRRRVDRGEGDRIVGRMLGLELPQALFDRGTAFVRGVVERGGDEGLARLWADPRALPTPAEVDAPGLWLERIDLPDGGALDNAD